MKQFYISSKHIAIVLLMIVGAYGHSLMASPCSGASGDIPQNNTFTFRNNGSGTMTITNIFIGGSISIGAGATGNLTCSGGSPTEFLYSGGTSVQVTSAANGGTYYTAMLSGGFIIIPGEVLQENYWGTEAPTKTYTPSCSTPFTYKLGAGAYQDIVIPANTYVDFSWNSNAGSTFGGINGYKATVSGGTGNSGVDGAFQFNTTSGWYSGSTDATIRVLAKRTNGSWDCNRYATLTISITPLSAPTGGTKSPNLTNICAGTGVSLSSTTAGTGGSGCSDDYIWLKNSVVQGAYTLGSNVGNTAAAGDVIEIQGRRGNCTASASCTATSYTTLASWTVVAQPTGPTGGTKSPNLSNICAGTNVSFSSPTAGSGGLGCSDDYIWLINGASQGAYTLGSNVGSGATATQVITIQGRRASCTSGAGCTGTGYTTLATWTVVAQPTGPTGGTKSPNLSNICAGTNVSFTSPTAGTGGTGCTDDYIWLINGVSQGAYTLGSNVGSGATATQVITIQGRRANCTSGAGCTGTGYTTLATWTVVAQPSAPTGGTKTPNLSNICAGTNVSFSSPTAGTGGAGCSDDYIWLINGVSQGTYTLGSNVGSGAVGSDVITIQGQRANCTAGAGCTGTGYATLATWTVVAQPTGPTGGTKTPNLSNICAGTNVSFSSPTAGSGGLGCSDDYIWLINGVSQGAYTLGSNVGSGATATQVITIQGRRSNCSANTGCTGNYATLATWNVVAQPTGPTGGTKSPNLLNICAGTNVSFSSPTAGTGGTGCSDDYIWLINGVLQGAYTLGSNVGSGAVASDVITIQGQRSNCTSGAGCTGTGYVTLATWNVVAQPTGPTGGTKSPNLSNICAGTNVSFSSPTAGTGGAGCSDDYIWLINGVSQGTYTLGSNVGSGAVGSDVIAIQGQRANCTSSAGCTGTGYATLATWTVVAQPTAGSIGNAQTICNGVDPAAITSTSAGTGSGTITYRWESSPDNSNWTAIGGEVLATYDPPVLTSTMYYRRITISTNGANICESTNTTPVQITVQSVPTAGIIGNAQTICNNTTPVAISSTTAGTGSGTISYRWESSVSPFSTWNSESGSGATFSPSALTQTTQYRRFTISTLSGNICESTSATTPIQITVQSVPTAGTISSSNIVVCTDGDPAAFNNDVSGTGDGTISYRWEKSVDPFSSWTTIGSATGATYDPPAPLPQTTKFRRYTVSTVGANACESSSPSNEITIYTDDNNSGGTIANTNSTRTCVINDANWHYFRNDAGEVIAAVNSNGEDLGSTTMTVTIEDNLHTYNSVNYDSPEHGDGGLGRNGACYGLPELSMRRWYTITPTYQPTADCNVKLFFTGSDYSNYASEITSWDTDHTGQNSYSFCYGSTSNNLDLVISKDESYDLLSVIGKSATGGPGGTTEYEFTVPSFSTFRFHTTSGIGGPLPVELLSFNGYFSNSSNVLEWVTLSEINSQKFVIEKSINATNWTVIGEVAAAGNSNQRLEYTFIDINPEVGNNYYRLKIIDFDGTYSYSGVIDILVDGITENKIVNLYPNPTNGSTTITAILSSVQNQTVRVDIIDMLGRIVLSQNVELTSGYNNIKLDVNVLNGTYVLRYIDNNGKSHYGKFIKN